MIQLTVSFDADQEGKIIAPMGFSTPHLSPLAVEVKGADQTLVGDAHNGQQLFCLRPTVARPQISWSFQKAGCAYPDAMFQPRESRFTQGANAMCASVVSAVGDILDPAQRLKAVVSHVTELFTYGHADVPFYDGHDAVPELCSLTVGSCVDINAYLIAACRAVGIDAGYVTGYFIPEEKRSHTSDMHCWVVTRVGDQIQEWDIAHHLKMDTRDIQPGLNPKPGVRVPMAHSMGWTIPSLGVVDAKLMAEPMWLLPDGSWRRALLDIQLQGYDLLAG